MRWIGILGLICLFGCTAEKSPPKNASAPKAPDTAKPQASTPAETAKLPEEKAPVEIPTAPPTETEKTKAPIAADSPAHRGTPPEAFDFPQPPLVMPAVMLTDREAATCLVNVGDKMPDLTLPDLKGSEQQLSKLLGPELTVVAFWTSTKPFAIEEIRDLGPLVGQKHADKGVKVVLVSKGEPAAAAQAALKKAGVDFVNLVDADGEAFGKVATQDLPRTYLLDSTGKILWFDMEYSRSTRRDLLQAIQFSLSAAN